MYRLVKDPRTGELLDIIIRTSDGASIPGDPKNADQQEYAKWLALGNQPEPSQ